MIAYLKKHKFLVVVFLAYVALMLLNPIKGQIAIKSSGYYLFEMAQILPVIFMLTVGIDVLVPKEWIVEKLGQSSSIKGALLALALGSLSAGPIYAAFPIAKTLHKKGASVQNVVIIISAWAVIKLPMLANEMKFLGPNFMGIRWILTVAFIFIMSFMMRKTKIVLEEETDQAWLSIHPEYCVGCMVCEHVLPNVFTVENGKVVLKTTEDVPKEKIKAVAAQCPGQAIELNMPNQLK